MAGVTIRRVFGLGSRLLRFGLPRRWCGGCHGDRLCFLGNNDRLCFLGLFGGIDGLALNEWHGVVFILVEGEERLGHRFVVGVGGCVGRRFFVGVDFYDFGRKAAIGGVGMVEFVECLCHAVRPFGYVALHTVEHKGTHTRICLV